MKKRCLLVLCILAICILFSNRIFASETKIEYEYHTNKKIIKEYETEALSLYEDYNDYIEYNYQSETNLLDSYSFSHYSSYGNIEKRGFEVLPKKEGIEKGKIVAIKTNYDNGLIKKEIIEEIPIEIEFTKDPIFGISTSIYSWNESNLSVGDKIQVAGVINRTDGGYSATGTNVVSISGESIKITEESDNVYYLQAIKPGRTTVEYGYKYDNNDEYSTITVNYDVKENNLESKITAGIYDSYKLTSPLTKYVEAENINYSVDEYDLKVSNNQFRNEQSLFIEDNFGEKEKKYLYDFSERNYKTETSLNYTAYKSGNQTITFYDNGQERQNIVNVEEAIYSDNLIKNNKKDTTSSFNIETNLDLKNSNHYFNVAFNSLNEDIAELSDIYCSVYNTYLATGNITFKNNGNTDLIMSINAPLGEYYSTEIDELNGYNYYSKEWYENIYGIDSLCFEKIYNIVVNDEYIPEKVILDKESVNAYVGMPISLASDIYPNSGENTELEWISSDESIAKVSQNGVIIPVKKGTATISAKSKKYNDICANCTVNVFNDNNQPKVNVYLKSPYIFNDWGDDNVAEGYVFIKDYYYDSDYSIEWEPINNNSEIDFRGQEKQTEFNGKIINIEDYEPDVYTINYKIKSKQKKDISGYIKVYEDGRLIEKQKINLAFDSRIRNGNIIMQSNVYLFNTENLMVGDRMSFGYSNLENVELLEGNCTINNKTATFTDVGMQKIKVEITDSYNNFKIEKIYQFNIKENDLEIDINPETEENGIINVGIGASAENSIGFFKNINYGNLPYCEIKILGEDMTVRGIPQAGGGFGQTLSYNQRNYYGVFQTKLKDSENSRERLTFLKPGIQKVSLLNSNGDEITQLTYNIMEPHIEANIPNNVTETINISSQIMQRNNLIYSTPLHFYAAPIALIGSVEVEDNSVLEIENQSYEKDTLNATLIPKKDGKTNVIVKYKVNFTDYFSEEEIDPSIGEKYYSKNWYEKKYGDVCYEKKFEVNVNIPQFIKGDLDRNQVVDANDASIALEIFKAENATAEDIAIGDMDGNNLIDANDASLILELYKTNN